MTDSESPQQDPLSEPAPGASPSSGPPLEQGEIPAAPVTGNGGSNGGSGNAAPPAAGEGALSRLKDLASGRRALWAAVAVICVSAGTATSVLVANSVARNDQAKARAAFHQSVTSTGIASTVRLALQQEEDLLVGASTFFSANPKASASQFSAWAGYANALVRYPELQKLGFVALVRAPEPVLSTRTSLTTGSLRLRSTQRETLARAA
ncbi:MAG: hypothetical protein JWL67_1470, partial [Solirubrobacterales bacterium]|nr:hypothetical protein [Solirubrobacterales bacterium]